MTVDFDHTPFSVTVRHAERTGPREYRAVGDIFRRDTGKNVHQVTGTGGARTSAEDAAIRAARTWASIHT
jgi:hypothetical protein